MPQYHKLKLPCGCWHTPLLFSLLRKVSSLSSFRSDSSCISGLASISKQGETVSEQPPLRSLCRSSCRCRQADIPSKGLETGVVPLDLLHRGEETGVMAVGDARPAEHTRRQFSIFQINGGSSQRPESLLMSRQHEHAHKYAQVGHQTQSYLGLSYGHCATG